MNALTDSRSIADFEPFIVQPHTEGGWEVVQDGKTTGALCLGELLETVVKLAVPGTPGPRYAMHTPEEWEARRQRRSAEGAPA